MHSKWIIFSTVLSGWMGIAVINPLMGPITRSMGLSELHAGLLIAITGIMVIVGSLYLGQKSDVWGRKKVLLIGMTGFTVTMLLFGICVQIGLAKQSNIINIFLLLMMIRLIQGLFFGAIPSTGQAYMADITTGKDRITAMSLISSTTGLGFVFGPILGALTAGFHIATPFFIIALITAVVTVWIWVSLANKKTSNNNGDNADAAKPILFSKVWLPLACSLLLTMSLSIMQVISGFYIQDMLHLTVKNATRYVGVFLSTAGLTLVFAQILIVNRFRWSPNKLMSIGLPIVCLGFVLLSISHEILYFLISFMLIGIGIGMSLPGSMSAASLIVDRTQQGKIAGMITALNGIGAVIAPLLGSFLYRFSPQVPFYTCILLLVGASLLIWTLGRKILKPFHTQVGENG
jgi:MFS family permease